VLVQFRRGPWPATFEIAAVAERHCHRRKTLPIHLAMDGSSRTEFKMSGILGDIGGAIGGAVSDIFGGGGGDSGGGGDFLLELLQAFEGSQSNSNSNSDSTMSQVGQIAGDVAPLLAAFL
jgi:hypothetical protein